MATDKPAINPVRSHPFKALRERAEERAHSTPTDIAGMTTEDVQRLVHQMHIQQMELELQNEELRDALGELVESRDRYVNLYEFAPVGYVTLNQDGAILEANLAAAMMLGVERQTLLRANISNFVIRQSQDACYLHRQMVFSVGNTIPGVSSTDASPRNATEGVPYGERQICELNMRKADGTPLAVRLESIAFGAEIDRRCRTTLIDLTAERRVQQQLLESEQRYRRLTEAVTDYIYRVRVEHGQPVETIHGAGCEAVTGYRSEEFASDPMLWIAMVPPEDRGAVERQAACILSGQDAVAIEHRIRRKDGQIRWVLNTTSPQRDEQGRLIAYDGLLRDITERKRAEEELQRLNEELEQRVNARTVELRRRTDQLAQQSEALENREREFRTLAANVPALFSYIDRDQRYRYVNRGYEETFQQPAREIVGKTVAELVGPQPFEIVRPNIEAALQGEKVAYEGEFDFPNGKHVMHVNYVPDLDEQGCVQGLFALVTDITARKQAEQQVQLLAEAISHLGEGVLITNDHLDWPGPHIVFVNKAMCRITGYTADELVGQTPRILQGKDTDRRTLDRTKAELSAGRSCLAELINYRKDGTPYDAELFITPLLDAEGRRTNFVSIHRDVSHRKQNERRGAAQYALTRVLAQSPTIDEAIPEILRVICDGLDWQFGELWQHDPVDDVLRNKFVWHPASLNLREFIRVTQEMTFRRGEGLIGRVWNEGRPLWVTDVTTDSRFVRASAAHALGLRAFFAIPISSGERVIGVAAFFDPEPRDPDHELLNQLDVFGKQVGDFFQRKQAEQALRKSEERLRAILNTAADAIITIDQRGIINGVNPATEQMFGYTQEELIGQNVKILMPPPYCDEHDGYIARYLETGEARIIGVGREAVGRRRDGSTIPIDLAVSKVDHLGIFTGIIRDITDRKKAEKALQREHELNESIVNTAQNIVLVLDTEGRIVRFNPYMEELTGWQLDEVQGRNWFDLFLPEHDRQRIRHLFGRALQGQRTLGNVSAILTKDGHEREIQWYDAPLSGSEGDRIGLLCIGLDVTERRMLEREILEIAAEEQRRIGQELHDSTQQQLTGLSLLAQKVVEVLAQLGRDRAAAGLLDRIEEAHQRATQVRNGLQQAAREVNQLSRGLIPVEVDAQGLMSSLTELARSVSEVQQTACTFACNSPIEMADNFTATHLYRIAQEAVSNAVKHSRGNRIEISLAELNNTFTLKVLDNGRGIDEKRAIGPGMGLRIMAYRAELIGAALTVGQTDEGGTEVVCTLPT